MAAEIPEMIQEVNDFRQDRQTFKRRARGLSRWGVLELAAI